MSDLNPGDRVKLRNLQPGYLDGVRGTLVRRQPGECRSLVRLDNDPQARKWKGMELCISNVAIGPDDTTEGIFGLIAEGIDPAARRAARHWLSDIAPMLETAAETWALTHTGALGYEWEQLRPALLWRFYAQLANETRMIAEGHETVLFQERRET
jgi:hypothetical protein